LAEEPNSGHSNAGTDPEFERMRFSFDLQCVGAQAACAQAIELPSLVPEADG